ncbi:MAG: response regulator [Cytophagaceae bacterium]|nr:response regulator [Cytophagaceae bacterium]
MNLEEERIRNMKPAKRVVIIDDEEDLCLLLGAFLRKQNARVDYALTLKEGLLKIAQEQPDLILLDNNLPDGMGIDKIAINREDGHGDRIVMMSAMSAMNNLRERALAAGVEEFLEKPVSFAAISHLV